MKSERYQRAEDLGIDMETDRIRPEWDVPDTYLQYIPHACSTATLAEYGNANAWMDMDTESTVEIHE